MKTFLHGSDSNNLRIPTEVKTENSPCPLGCIGQDSYVLTSCDYIHDLAGDFNVVKCGACGLMRTNPRPTPETMGYYYPDNYGPYQAVWQDENKNPNLYQKAKRFFLDKIIPIHSTLVPNIKVGRMLEFGCGSGFFLVEMSRKGWDVTGIDANKTVCEKIEQAGYTAHNCFLENAPDPKKPYDLIVGWMALEHTHEPLACLQKIKEWLKDDGVIALSVPNAGSYEFELFNEHWFPLQLPAHLTHFTPETFECLANKAGLKVEKIIYQKTLSNIFVSLGYMLKHKNRFSWLSKKLIADPSSNVFVFITLYPLALLQCLFHQSGRMTVWIKKDN